MFSLTEWEVLIFFNIQAKCGLFWQYHTNLIFLSFLVALFDTLNEEWIEGHLTRHSWDKIISYNKNWGITYKRVPPYEMAEHSAAALQGNKRGKEMKSQLWATIFFRK